MIQHAAQHYCSVAKAASAMLLRGMLQHATVDALAFSELVQVLTDKAKDTGVDVWLTLSF